MSAYTFRWKGPKKDMVENISGLQVTLSPVTPEVTIIATIDDDDNLHLLEEGMAEENFELVTP